MANELSDNEKTMAFKADVIEMAHDEAFFSTIKDEDTRIVVYDIGREMKPLNELKYYGVLLIEDARKRFKEYKLKQAIKAAGQPVEDQEPATDQRAGLIEQIHRLFIEGHTGEDILAAVSSGLDMYAGFIADNSEIAAEDRERITREVTSISARIYSLAGRMAALEAEAFPPAPVYDQQTRDIVAGVVRILENDFDVDLDHIGAKTVDEIAASLTKEV